MSESSEPLDWRAIGAIGVAVVALPLALSPLGFVRFLGLLLGIVAIAVGLPTYLRVRSRGVDDSVLQWTGITLGGVAVALVLVHWLLGG